MEKNSGRSRILLQTFLLVVVVMAVYICFYKDDLGSITSPRPWAEELSEGSTTPPGGGSSDNTSPPNISLPRCEKNPTVSSITGFSSLPDHLKKFLHYRHCRHFPLLLDVPDKCGGADKSGDVFLLLVIKSSPGNYDRREVLRKTWARERLHGGVWIRRVFLSGTSGVGLEKKKMNNLVKAENHDYGDVLQWDFADTFHNLTLKQILFLEWMERNCPNARFLLNGDDDVFAHTGNMVVYLQNLKDNNGSKHLFTGQLLMNEKAVRWTASKYYVPAQIQKADTYQPYCGGGGYLLSAFTAMVIYRMSWQIPIHPIDDAYMGMCLAKAGLKPSSHIGVRTLDFQKPTKSRILEPCFLKELLLVHRFLPSEMFLMWKKIHDPNLHCSTSVNTEQHQNFTYRL